RLVRRRRGRRHFSAKKKDGYRGAMGEEPRLRINERRAGNVREIFYGTEHWNYFTNDEDLGPVILSIKQETLNSRDQF
ncbi:hypothetical protein HHI36_009776, partial [Cryptolaemus montrouzieri]